MSVRIDHLALPARDADWSARYLATLLGDIDTRPGGDMTSVLLDGGTTLLYTSTPEVHPGHVALRVDAERFARVVDELRARRVPFGNDPEAPDNGRTSDPLGAAGRVYFPDPDGNLIEIVTGG